VVVCGVRQAVHGLLLGFLFSGHSSTRAQVSPCTIASVSNPSDNGPLWRGRAVLFAALRKFLIPISFAGSWTKTYVTSAIACRAAWMGQQVTMARQLFPWLLSRSLFDATIDYDRRRPIVIMEADGFELPGHCRKGARMTSKIPSEHDAAWRTRGWRLPRVRAYVSLA
jgi:hypothetical protein